MLTLRIRRCVVVIVLVYDQILLFFFFLFFVLVFFFATLKLLVIKGLEILMCFSDYFFHLIKQLQTILAEMEEK